MRILITNDDGIEAPGIKALADEIRRHAQVVVCAPHVQRSAVSSSITLYTPLIVQERKEKGVRLVAIQGTPADAVKLALSEILDEPPDLVLSGINHGLNTGSNILYSGTVAAALEAAQVGVPAMALSLEAVDDPPYAQAARFSWKLIQWLRRAGDGRGVVYNVNFPGVGPKELKGIQITHQESTPYQDVFERRVDPRGRTYYWLCGSPEARYKSFFARNGSGPEPSDAWAVANGFVSVTPLNRDLTARGPLDKLRKVPKPPVR